jgi:regulator of replication initiation timing
MALRFMGKYQKRKVVKQIPNTSFSHRIDIPKEEEIIEENNDLNIEKDMADERLEKIEQIIGAKAPKRVIKREKRDKGLIERTENSTILLTEDNKMVLND